MVTSIVTLLLSVDWSKSDNTKATTDERIVELEREIAHLKGTVYEASLDSRDGTVSALVPAEPASAASSEQELINHTVESMRWTMTVRGVMPPTREHLEKAHNLIFDDEVSVKRKLVAVRILRNCDKLGDEVTAKMVEVFYRTSDFNMQAEILNLLDGQDTPVLAQALLEASSSSPNALVRKEAVDALSGFLPDPDLFAWLRQVAASDSDKDVQREAERLLKKHAANISN